MSPVRQHLLVATIVAASVCGADCSRAQIPDDALVAQAVALVDRGEYRKALELTATDPTVAAEPGSFRFSWEMVRAEALLGAAFYDGASDIARRAVTTGRAVFRDSSDQLADAWLLLARAEINRANRTEEAAQALQQALTVAIAADGPNSLRALRAKDRIALVISGWGRAAEAEQDIRLVLAQAESLAVNPVRDRMRFTNTLGIALLRQSKFEAARDAFAAAREGRAQLLTDRHPETLESQHNLGFSLRRLGQRDNADSVFVATLQLRAEVLGPDHPDTLITRTMIVRQLIDKSEFQEAASEAKAVVAALSRRLARISHTIPA